jgi:cytoskeletal protein CcmA (bactofilin family)
MIARPRTYKQGTNMDEDTNTRLGPTAHVTGSLVSDEDVRIEGRFDGPVSTTGDLVIAADARVAGDLTANDVRLEGRVEGTVDATGQLEIGSQGVLLGDIRAAGLTIRDGGRFKGQVSMNAGMASEDGEDVSSSPPLPDPDDDEPPAWDTDEHRAAEARARVESAYVDTTGSHGPSGTSLDGDAPPRRSSIDQLGITRRQPGEGAPPQEPLDHDGDADSTPED